MRIVAALLVLAACSDSSTPAGPIRIDQFEATYEAYYCSYLVRCGLLDDMATCRSLRMQSSELSPLFDDTQVQAALADLITYDGQAAADCLGGYFSTCVRGYVATPRAAPAACSQVFVATAKDAAACGANEECISGICNETGPCTGSCCQGTCYGATPPAPRPTLGESCQMNTACVESYCDTPSYICSAYLTLGMQCSTSDQCEAGLACRNSVCASLAATGDPCNSDDDCQSVGDHCASNVCTKFGLIGTPCTSNECSPAYRCDTTSHTCAFGPKLGESCPQGFCVDASYCDQTTSICTALLPDGASCQYSQQCTGNYCDTSIIPGTCTSFPTCF